MDVTTDFRPDWASAPGDTITDILEERAITLLKFARQMGCTVEYTKELIQGSIAITNETARKLELTLGGSADFWIARECQYREDLERLQNQVNRAERSGWLGEIPVKDMIEFGWISPVSSYADKEQACLKFFGVPDINIWRDLYRHKAGAAAYRTSSSFESKFGALAAWLRRGEIESESIQCDQWDPKRLNAILPMIRHLTRDKNPQSFIPKLQKLCAECGVAVVIVRAPSGCRASGAVRFISEDKAILQLSFRYLSDDHFWFTFFHEVGHLLLHKKGKIFIEDIDAIPAREEEEANEFSTNILIPPTFRNEMMRLKSKALEVIKFAVKIDIAPGIVVGQLQHLQRIPQNHLNRLKRRFSWK